VLLANLDGAVEIPALPKFVGKGRKKATRILLVTLLKLV